MPRTTREEAKSLLVRGALDLTDEQVDIIGKALDLISDSNVISFVPHFDGEGYPLTLEVGLKTPFGSKKEVERYLTKRGLPVAKINTLGSREKYRAYIIPERSWIDFREYVEYDQG